MKLDDLRAWMKSATYVDTIHEEHDSSTNCWETRVYQLNDQYYLIGFCNSHPLEKSKGKEEGYGIIRGDFAEPIPVERKTRMVEEVYYE